MPENAQVNTLPSLLRIILLVNRPLQVLEKWDAFSCKITYSSVHTFTSEMRIKNRSSE